MTFFGPLRGLCSGQMDSWQWTLESIKNILPNKVRENTHIFWKIWFCQFFPIFVYFCVKAVQHSDFTSKHFGKILRITLQVLPVFLLLIHLCHKSKVRSHLEGYSKSGFDIMTWFYLLLYLCLGFYDSANMRDDVEPTQLKGPSKPLLPFPLWQFSCFWEIKQSWF